MARNTGRGSPAAEAPNPRIGDPQTRLWERRNPVSGKFTEAKKTGGSFKGTRRAG